MSTLSHNSLQLDGLIQKRIIRRENKKYHAHQRLIEKLEGEDVVESIRASWKNLHTNYGQKDYIAGQEIIIGFMNRNFSEMEIRTLLGIGGEKMAKIKRCLANGSDYTGRLKSSPRSLHPDAIVESDIDFVKLNFLSWPVEDGSVCDHRTTLKYFVECGLTLKVVWTKYKERCIDPDGTRRFVSYSKWCSLVSSLFPEYRFSRTSEDVCPLCETGSASLNEPSAMCLPTMSLTASSDAPPGVLFYTSNQFQYYPIPRQQQSLSVDPQHSVLPTDSTVDLLETFFPPTRMIIDIAKNGDDTGLSEQINTNDCFGPLSRGTLTKKKKRKHESVFDS